MNNKTAIRQTVYLAHWASRLSVSYARFGASEAAKYWRTRSQHHMATARQLKQDAQQ